MALLSSWDKRTPGIPRVALHIKAQSPSVMALCAPIVLTDPTKSKRPASYFTTRVKSPQHKFNGRVVLLGVRSPSALASLNNAPRASTLIMALHKMHKPTESNASQNVQPTDHGSPPKARKPPFSSRSLSSVLFILHLRGMARSHPTREDGAFCPFVVVSGTCSPPLLPFLKYKNVGKNHRGQSHTGELIISP